MLGDAQVPPWWVFLSSQQIWHFDQFPLGQEEGSQSSVHYLLPARITNYWFQLIPQSKPMNNTSSGGYCYAEHPWYMWPSCAICAYYNSPVTKSRYLQTFPLGTVWYQLFVQHWDVTDGSLPYLRLCHAPASAWWMPLLVLLSTVHILPHTVLTYLSYKGTIINAMYQAIVVSSSTRQKLLAWKHLE